jgi:MraZ protein
VERFFGRYEHSLDTKGRLVLPARLRSAFDEVGGFLVKGRSGSVALWPRERYEARLADLEDKLAADEDDDDLLDQERLFSAAEYVVPDGQGRILIAPYLQEYGGLQRERVLVLGANRIVEIWDPQRWQDEVEGPAEQRLRARRRTEAQTEAQA